VRPYTSAKFHYVSVSRRYHYPNRWMDDGQNHTMAQHVEDVAAFIRALNVGKVHLVGNSYGGNVVARVALKYPELLRSVVAGEGLIDPVPPPVSAEDKAAVAAAQKANEKIRQAVQARDVRQAATLQYDAALGEQGAFEKLPRERQEQLLETAKTMLLERAPTPLSCDQLRTLSVPALLIRGEKTAAAGRHRFEMTIACLPKTTDAAVIPGAPHSWYQRNPEDSAKAILTFIAKH
jgi:esterase